MVSSYISQESEKEMDLDAPNRRMALDSRPWHAGILSTDDLIEIDPPRARFLQQLQELATHKRHILHDNSLSESDKLRQVRLSGVNLRVDWFKTNVSKQFHKKYSNSQKEQPNFQK
jgi:hypothetical protein